MFVCFKDSHRNNKKLKPIIWLLFWILFYINKHNRQMNTMMWQGSGILAPRDDIKWRKRKVILHKSCPIGNGGSSPSIIAKHCGVEQSGSSPGPRQSNSLWRVYWIDIFWLVIHLIMKWVRLSYSVLTWRSWVRVPLPLQKIQNIFINIWIFQIFLLYLYC